MSNNAHKLTLVIVMLAGLALSPLALSHFNDKEIPQSYRQSWFTLLALNFGPMVSTLKGEIPWDNTAMAAYADQLAALTSMDVSRGFAEGSDKGTTRAKPEIWSNKADFESKFEDLKAASLALQSAVAAGDRKAIAAEIAATGKSCKACHDEYKSKDYLY
jgi:cytochrome c556